MLIDLNLNRLLLVKFVFLGLLVEFFSVPLIYMKYQYPIDSGQSSK